MTADDVIATLVRLEARAAKVEAAYHEAMQKLAAAERERDDAMTRAEALTAELAKGGNVSPFPQVKHE